MNKANTIVQEIQKAISGKDEVIEKVVMTMLAGGHILLEDVPGVGKTTLALAISKALGMKFNRIQFTPDVVPSDIVGFTMYDKEQGKFRYVPGAVVCNLLLADEINRTSAKTQSALLEVMQEGKISIDGRVLQVPNPFVVIATQNPLGTVGTQKLPEAQLDRFMVRLHIGYPDRDAQIQMMKNREQENPLNHVNAIASAADMEAMRQSVRQIHTDTKIYEYITDLCEATRDNEYIRLGLSPRASLAIAQLSRSCAFMHNRDYVVPSDVREVFLNASEHRVVLSPKASLEQVEVKTILDNIMGSVTEPKVN